MLFDLNKWMTEKCNGDVLIERVGTVSESYIDDILPAMEQRLQDKFDKGSIRKRAFHIIVECVQNLYHHADTDSRMTAQYGADRLGCIIITKVGDDCHISTGNFVKSDKTMGIKKQIDYINSLSQEQLRNLYRNAVGLNDFSEKGGAGLGMIDMARKSGNELVCQFYPVKDMPNLNFFSLDVVISQ